MFGVDRHAGPEFLQELADDVTLSASLLNEKITGRKAVKSFIFELVSRLHSVESLLRVSWGTRDFFVYSALLESGQSVEGTLILTRNAKGEVSNAMMSHSPYPAVEALVGMMSADRATRSSAKSSWFSKVLSYADWLSQ